MDPSMRKYLEDEEERLKKKKKKDLEASETKASTRRNTADWGAEKEEKDASPPKQETKESSGRATRTVETMDSRALRSPKESKEAFGAFCVFYKKSVTNDHNMKWTTTPQYNKLIEATEKINTLVQNGQCTLEEGSLLLSKVSGVHRWMKVETQEFNSSQLDENFNRTRAGVHDTERSEKALSELHAELDAYQSKPVDKQTATFHAMSENPAGAAQMPPGETSVRSPKESIDAFNELCKADKADCKIDQKWNQITQPQLNKLMETNDKINTLVQNGQCTVEEGRMFFAEWSRARQQMHQEMQDFNQSRLGPDGHDKFVGEHHTEKSESRLNNLNAILDSFQLRPVDKQTATQVNDIVQTPIGATPKLSFTKLSQKEPVSTHADQQSEQNQAKAP